MATSGIDFNSVTQRLKVRTFSIAATADMVRQLLLFTHIGADF